MIKNLTSLTIYNGETKYIFLGDQHIINNTNCEGISIDTLLKHWLQYNENHQITTNLYAEVHFTKSNQRKIVKEGNVLQLLPQKINCFNKDKCYDYVKLHYVDIRNIDVNQLIISVDPFDLSRLRYLANLGKIAYDKIIIILKTIKENYMNLLNFLLLPMDYKKINLFLQLDKAYSIVFKYINEHAVVRKIGEHGRKMTRTAASMFKLRNKDAILFRKLLNFIYKKAELYMATINFDEEIKLIQLTEYSNNKDLINNALISADNKLLQLGALVMDTYTLARMFTQPQSNEIIVYAGVKHIDLYIDFFKILQLKPDYSIDDKHQCLYNDQLLNYLNIDAYMNT